MRHHSSRTFVGLLGFILRQAKLPCLPAPLDQYHRHCIIVYHQPNSSGATNARNRGKLVYNRTTILVKFPIPRPIIFKFQLTVVHFKAKILRVGLQKLYFGNQNYPLKLLNLNLGVIFGVSKNSHPLDDILSLIYFPLLSIPTSGEFNAGGAFSSPPDFKAGG